MSVRVINKDYKKSIETSLRSKTFCPFRYEKQMGHLFSLLEKDFKKKNKLEVSEVGCGQGRLLFYLNQFNDKQNYTGIDYMKPNIDYAKKLFKDNENITLEKQDFFKLPNKYKKQFDISISYKTLSWLPDYKEAIRQLIKVTKNKIYITSLFYDGKLSFLSTIYDHKTNTYIHLNTYSFSEFKKFCLKNGVKSVKSINMSLDIDLPEPKNKDILQTFTIRESKGRRIEITGNTILNWKLIILNL